MATDAATLAGADEHARKDYKIWQVIGASSAGTVIEWYDFYIFGSLAATIAPKFYPEGNDTLALVAYLSTFAVGFLVRPFGAAFLTLAERLRILPDTGEAHDRVVPFPTRRARASSSPTHP